MKNGVMMQYFEWYLPDDGHLWQQLKEDAPHLSSMGITSVWIPPACKATGSNDTGYGIYDLYDLGEFDQKGCVRTKYGTKQQLQEAIEALHANGINVYMDTVLNHKAGADHTEKCTACEVSPDNRNTPIGEPHEIECWTGFDFAGRGDTYSSFKWHWYHFTGVDYDEKEKRSGIFRIIGENKGWSLSVDDEFGNYDFLMFADIDYNHPDVINEVKNWGVWVCKELTLDGMRLDAVKHYDTNFIKEFTDNIRTNNNGKEFYFVGEYWKDDIEAIRSFIERTEGKIEMFDTCLHYNFHRASTESEQYDLRYILNDTLAQQLPQQAVTFVDNHDSQLSCALESIVEDWFKPAAYALILLMEQGYPCIFYGDYYSTNGKESPHRIILDILLETRHRYAYGEQREYLDHPNTIGIVRYGDDKHPGSGLALLISNSKDGFKNMNVGKGHAHEIWHEITGNSNTEIEIDDNGNADFTVTGGRIAVWVPKNTI